MTFQIRHDGRTFTVHTEVGDGPARVVFEEMDPQRDEPQSLDASGEPA